MANKIRKEIIEKAKKDRKILAVVLFGSSLKGKGRDIDICLFLDKKYSNLQMSKKRLEFLAACENNIDIQIFQQLPLYIRARVIKDAKILFCRDLDVLYDIVFQTIKEFGSFKRGYEGYLEAVKNG